MTTTDTTQTLKIELPQELEELKNLKQWVCYRLEPRPTQTDPDHLGKVPYNPITGYGAKAGDPSTWTDYETARKAVETGRYNGIGFELGSTGYCGIDIDHCITDAGLSDHAANIVNNIGSYTETSISGTGLHIIAKSAALEKNGYSNPKNGSGFDLEIYRPTEKKGGTFAGEVEGGRFLTISGKVYGDPKPITDQTAKIQKLVKHYWPKEEKQAAAVPVVSSLPAYDQDAEKKMLVSALNAIRAADLDFDDWSSIVTAMKYCGFTDQEAETWSASGGNPKHVDGYIYKRWNKFHLPNNDENGAAGVIVEEAKKHGWRAADAFTEEERRQYGRELHKNDSIKTNGTKTETTATPEPAEEVAPAMNLYDYLTGGKYAADLEQFQQNAEVQTGFQTLDQKIGGGLYAGLYVLGAVPTLGKTTFALQLADQIAERHNPVLFFSLEMSRLDLVTKSITRTARELNPGDQRELKTSLQLRKGYSSAEMDQAKQRYIETTAKYISIIECSFKTTADTIRATAEKFVKDHNETPVIIIDYLQILKPMKDSRASEARMITDYNIQALKMLASDLATPVIVISGFNRQNYNQTIGYESFRETSGIEYTADVLLGLEYKIISTLDGKNASADREAVNQAKESPEREIILKCLKNRFGQSYFEIPMKYYPRFDYFIEDTQRSTRTRQNISDIPTL